MDVNEQTEDNVIQTDLLSRLSTTSNDLSNVLNYLDIDDDTVSNLYDVIVECVIVHTIFNVHRTQSIGLDVLFIDLRPQLTQTVSRRNTDVDVFGQSPAELGKALRNQECTCPECSRSMIASRFAPHLEKCMGMGRSSRLAAKRRLAAHAQMSRCTPSSSSLDSRTRDAVVSGGVIAVPSDDDRSDDDSRVSSLPDDDDDWLSANKKPTRALRNRKVPLSVDGSSSTSTTVRNKTRNRSHHKSSTVVSSSANTVNPPALKPEEWCRDDEMDDDSLSALLPIVDETSQPPLLFAADDQQRSSPSISLRNRKVKKKSEWLASSSSSTKATADVWEESNNQSLPFADLLDDL